MNKQQEQALPYLYERLQLRLRGKENDAGFYHCECPFGHNKVDFNQATYNTHTGYFECKGQASHNHNWKALMAWLQMPLDSLPTHTPKPLPTPKERGPVVWNPTWFTALKESPSQVCRDLRLWLLRRGVDELAIHNGRLGYTGKDTGIPWWAQDKLAIPWRDVDGQVVAVKLRSLPHQNKAYMAIPNSNFTGGLYGYMDASPYACVVIHEAELDALAFDAWTGYCGLSVAAPTSHWNGPLGSYYMALLAGRRVYVARDGDSAGEAMLAAIRVHNPYAVELSFGEAGKDWGACVQMGTLPAWANAFKRPQVYDLNQLAQEISMEMRQ